MVGWTNPLPMGVFEFKVDGAAKGQLGPKIHTRILRVTYKWDLSHRYKYFSLGFDTNHWILTTMGRMSNGADL